MKETPEFKTILLMTDFSAHSKNACRYAIETFGFEPTYFLINTYEIKGSAATLIDIEGLAHQDSLEGLKEQEDDLRALFPSAKLKLNSVVKRGAPAHVINKFSKVENADLIVVGSKGISKLDEILIGSVTSAIMRGTELPVLSIPLGAKPSRLEQVVLASDLVNVKKENTVVPIKMLKNKFKSYVTTVTVADKSNKNLIENEASIATLKNESFSDEFVVLENQDISQAVTKYCAENKTDLLVVVAKHTGFFQRFFHKSITTELVNHESLPILVLEDS
jgi:nucleotide-binding universal stress UspA family protein